MKLWMIGHQLNNANNARAGARKPTASIFPLTRCLFIRPPIDQCVMKEARR
jgi:hypothetical protein